MALPEVGQARRVGDGARLAPQVRQAGHGRLAGLQERLELLVQALPHRLLPPSPVVGPIRAYLGHLAVGLESPQDGQEEKRGPSGPEEPPRAGERPAAGAERGQGEEPGGGRRAPDPERHQRRPGSQPPKGGEEGRPAVEG